MGRAAGGKESSDPISTLPPEPDRVRDVVERVLSEPEYADLDPARPTFFERLSEWLAERLGSAGEFLQKTPEWVQWVVLAWMVLTLFAIIGHAVYTFLLLARGRAGRRLHEAPGVDLSVYGVRERSFEEVYDEAQRAAARGDWERAVRYGYASAILWLDRAGDLRFEPHKTNFDYVREVERGNAGPSFRHMTDVFERVIYGATPATSQHGSQMASALEEVLGDEGPQAQAGTR